MSRLQQTEGLTEEQGELVKLVREFVERADHPGGHRARAPATSTRRRSSRA